MQETEKRLGLAIEAAHVLKMAVDNRYPRKAVINRTVLVKVDNDDYSPNPDSLVDIKAKLIDDQAALSVKTGSWHGDSTREEYEVNVHRADFGNLLTILRLLGYRRFILLVTTRTIWTGNGVIITLDEYLKLDKALFEVELEDADTGDEDAIDEVFASLGQEPFNSAQTIAFIASLNRAEEARVDLDRILPEELARELAVRH
jgi:adenylate cyclase class IV